ncbi:A/G-specific adenine glycosylase [Clonorchis sinensis]|uniref:Adenine DNA glycosylase n=1 Tax=Clonorchis sinensis TaxID=79923 RepID=G7YM99_CLOSI|nr:A/G-specific adenine glycosylase [Clonorchis sinensis]
MPADAYDSSQGVMNYPVKLSKRAARVERTVVIIAHAHDNGQTHFLLFQRPRTGLLAGLWEFPSQVTCASQSDSKQAEISDDAVDDGVILDVLIDRIAASCNLSLEDKTQLKPKLIGEVVHLFSHIRMTYVVHTLSLHALTDRSSRVGRWIELSDLQNASISTATRKILSHFQATLQTGSPRKSSGEPNRNKRRSSTPLLDRKQTRLDNFFR